MMRHLSTANSGSAGSDGALAMTAPDFELALAAGLRPHRPAVDRPAGSSAPFAAEGTGPEIHCEAGARLYEAGSGGHAVYLIRKGVLGLEQSRLDGSAAIVNILAPGEVAGFELLVTGAYDHTAVALSPVAAMAIPGDRVAGLGGGRSRQVLAGWHQSMVRTLERFRDFGSGSAEQRLARLLMLWDAADGGPVALPRSADLGAILGLAERAVEAALAGLKAREAIGESATGLRLRDRDLLAAIARAGAGERPGLAGGVAG
ncbi:MAG: Crp/Fnr family transcriptional regulator [Rhodospirillaceae bacterium]